MKTEHILIIRFSALGDVAMTVPVVYSLARQYPELRVTVLSRPFARPLFENMAPNVGFMEADIKGEYKGIKGLNALYRRLLAKQFTAIADLHNVLRSDYLRLRFNLNQYKVAHVNKHRAERKRLTQRNNKVLEPIQSSIDNYCEVLDELGYPVTLDFSTLLKPEETSLRQLPDAIGEKKPFQQWIGIAPFAAHKGKAYPLNLMEKVVGGLVQHHPSCRIFLFGGGQRERQQLEEMARRNTNCTVVPALIHGLRNEFILMSHLDVMVSMDSANMHLASLVATPVVSVWGATHPYAGFMGWNQKMENAVQTTLPCRPCSIFGNKPCLRGDYACLTAIKPDTIINKVEQII